MVLGPSGLSWLHFAITSANIKLAAEFTLALILFSDASKVNLRVLRQSARLPIRLLGIGLALTIGLGSGVAALLFREFSFEEAAILRVVLDPPTRPWGSR